MYVAHMTRNPWSGEYCSLFEFVESQLSTVKLDMAELFSSSRVTQENTFNRLPSPVFPQHSPKA
jgi:hypothetical protein